MKQFNIVKQDIILFEKYHLPINSCYGKYTSMYRKYVGTKQVITKRKKVVNKPQFETVTEEIIYYIDDFRPYKNYGEEQYLAYNIHVYDVQRDKWINTNTQRLAKYKPLGDFLARMFEKNDIKPTTKCKKWVDYKTGTPKDKKAQVFSDSIFKANVGYALSKTVMTCHNINRDGWFYDNSVKSVNNSI